MITPTSLRWDLFALRCCKQGLRKCSSLQRICKYKARQWRAYEGQGKRNIMSTRNYLSGGWFDSLGNSLILTYCKYFRRLHNSFCDRVRNSFKLISLFPLNQLLSKWSYKGEHNSSLAWQEKVQQKVLLLWKGQMVWTVFAISLSRHTDWSVMWEQMNHLWRQSCLHWNEREHITWGGPGPSEHRSVMPFCVNKK